MLGNGRIPIENTGPCASLVLFSCPADESAVNETYLRMTISVRNRRMKRRLLISVKSDRMG
jgi:hypothetical protein